MKDEKVVSERYEEGVRVEAVKAAVVRLRATSNGRRAKAGNMLND